MCAARIYILDDDPLERMLWDMNLRKLDPSLDIHTFETAAQFCQAVERTPPDIAVIDLVLEFDSGVYTCVWLLERYPMVRRFINTSYSAAAPEVVSAACGAAYLSKEVSILNRAATVVDAAKHQLFCLDEVCMRAAFYKAKGKWMDKLIRWWTKSPYSHCELLFPDGRMFSADAWYGKVRYTQNYNLENWDIVSLPSTVEQVNQLRSWCEFRADTKYDWLGVVWFVLPFVKQDPSKWFCSELCAAGLKFIGKIPVPTKTSKLSPQGLFELLKGG